ncbi:hypothetical protein GCM10011586_36340 [Silvibacterium dinghuense]|nr:hypothetical protein GCM10011586_36340 [Silvibacterium dinghuense]
MLAMRPCTAAAADGDAAKKDTPKDVIVFTNGDQLSGTLTREVGGNVVFHSDVVGDITVTWDKIKELRTQTKFAVLDKSVTPKRHKLPANVPQGTISVADNMLTVHPDNGVLIEPMPVKSAQYIVDESTMTKQLIGKPGFFEGWHGTATAGATIVEATQKQHTYSGAVSLARVVPTASFLNPTNRTTINFSGSYGKSTQPAYVSEGVLYPESDTKTALYHADAERDQYFKPRFYALAQTSFDHNYSLLLDLQQIYGGGIGWTVIKQPKQELDVKATIQYEKQTFINASGGTNQNLIGSTFGGTYLLHLPRSIVFNQQFSYIPAYNNANAYSATETDGLTFPTYKNFGFTFGTLDTYLNDPAPAVPATKRNSFQMTFGLSYAFKSKY